MASLNTDDISQVRLWLNAAIWLTSGQWDARSVMRSFLKVAFKG